MNQIKVVDLVVGPDTDNRPFQLEFEIEDNKEIINCNKIPIANPIVDHTDAVIVDDDDDDGKQYSPPRLYLLYAIILLQAVIFLCEMLADQMVHSMLIMADAYHHLFNVFNATLLAVCFKISNQKTLKNTFGWVRTEILGMLTTITFEIALIFSLLIEGCLQLLHLHEISNPTNPKILLVFGVWSLMVNVLFVLISNGIVTDKKYKQTTQMERSFSTAKCQKSISSLIRQKSIGGEFIGRNHRNDDDGEIKSSPPPPRQQQQDSSTTKEKSLIKFPRTDGGDVIKDFESIQLERLDDKFKTSANMPTATLNNPPPAATTTNSDFWRSLIQGVLSPCFLIICSFLILVFCEPPSLSSSSSTADLVSSSTSNSSSTSSSLSNPSSNGEMIDPTIGIITAISLIITFYPQLKNTFLILMLTVPENVDVDQLKNELLGKFTLIENIHNFHIWLLNQSECVAEFHMILPPQTTKEYCKLFEEIKQYLQLKYDINYITIQPEFQQQQQQSESSKNNNNNCSNCNNNTDKLPCLKHQCLVRCPCDDDDHGHDHNHIDHKGEELATKSTTTTTEAANNDNPGP